jgi:hypothetical protein
MAVMTHPEPDVHAEETTPSRAAVYLALLVIGQLSLTQIIPFTVDHGFGLREMWDQAVATRISTALALDVALSSVTLWVWMSLERRIVGALMALVVVANLTLGLSFALPLYLLLRIRAQRL